MPVPRMSPTMNSSSSFGPITRLSSGWCSGVSATTVDDDDSAMWVLLLGLIGLLSRLAGPDTTIPAVTTSRRVSLRQLAFANNCKQTGRMARIRDSRLGEQLGSLGDFIATQRVSAETLYVRAGILDPDDHAVTSVEMAVLADSAITERQKRVLIDVYASFVKENESAAAGPDDQS